MKRIGEKPVFFFVKDLSIDEREYPHKFKEDVIMSDLKSYVTDIPDFPEKGVIFRDITTVLQDPEGLKLAIDTMQEKIKDIDFDVIVGTESRGFIFGMPIAYNLGKAFILARKPGKLPREVVSIDYDLEYGKATIEMHKDSIKPGQKVLIVDDLIATGGTLEATATLVEELGGEIAGISAYRAYLS